MPAAGTEPLIEFEKVNFGCGAETVIHEASFRLEAGEQKIMLLCEFAKRLAVMDRGRLILAGTVGEVLSRGEVLEAAGVNIPRVSALARRLTQAGLYQREAGALPVNLEQARTMMEEVIRHARCGD